MPRIRWTIFIPFTALWMGCARHAIKATPQDAGRQGGRSNPASLVEAAEPTLHGSEMHAIPELETINFDFDSAILTLGARSVLKANADWLREHADLKVQVAGHCDQRGTIEYNLSLGQRRAAAVREYYLLLGVPGSQVGTISYGRERLLCQTSGEDCWRRNRRAETLAAAPVVAAH